MIPGQRRKILDLTPGQRNKILDFIDEKLRHFQVGAWYWFRATKLNPHLVPADELKPIQHREYKIVTTRLFDDRLNDRLVFILEPEVVIISQINSDLPTIPAIKVLCDEKVVYVPLGFIQVNFNTPEGALSEEETMVFKFLPYVSIELYKENEK